MKNKALVFIMLLFTSIVYGNEKIDIGKTEGTVFIQLNDKVYDISGSGKIDAKKFKDYYRGTILKNTNSSDYTIKIDNNNIQFPDNSDSLFLSKDILSEKQKQEQGLSEEEDSEPLIKSNILLDFPENMKTTNIVGANYMFADLKNANPKIVGWNTSNITRMYSMFRDSDKINPDVSGWDTGKVVDMGAMFMNAKSATPDVTTWNVSNVTSILGMFQGASSATPNVSQWKHKTHNMTDISYAFYGLKIKPAVDDWDVSNVTNMQAAFKYVAENPNISKWNMEKVENIYGMFYDNKTNFDPNIIINKSMPALNNPLYFYTSDNNNISEINMLPLLKNAPLILNFDKPIIYINNNTMRIIFNKQLSKNIKLYPNSKYSLIKLGESNRPVEYIKEVSTSTSSATISQIIPDLTDTDNYLLYKSEIADAINTITSLGDLSSNKRDDYIKKLIELEKSTGYTRGFNGTESGKLNDIVLLAQSQDTENKKIKEAINLNNAQKKALKEEVEQQISPENVQIVSTKVKKLDDLMGELKSKVDAESNVEQTSKYKLADLDNQSAYKEAVSNGNQVLEKTSGENKNSLEVQALIDAIETKKSELNGDNNKETAKGEIEKLGNLSPEQKKALQGEVETATSKTDIEGIVTKAKTLENEMEKLNNKLKEIKPESYYKAKPEAKEMYDNKLKELETLSKVSDNLDPEVIKNTLKELENIISVELSVKDLNQYTGVVKSLYYIDTSVVNDFDKGVYVDVNLGTPAIDILRNTINKSSYDLNKVIGGIRAGVNGKVNANTSLGAFVEYENQNAQQLSLGLNYTTGDLLGFVRYRLASIYKDKMILNHNVDMYNRYMGSLSIDNNLSYRPSLGIYVTYSGATRLDEDVMLDQRFGGVIDYTGRLEYKTDSLKLYMDTVLGLSLGQNQYIYQEGKNNIKEIEQDYIRLGLLLGVDKKFTNNVVLGATIGVDQNNVKGSVDLGYNW